MATHYHLPEPVAMPVPTLTGRYLAHNHLDTVTHAFIADDLHTGATKFINPTMTQVAYLARVNVTYAWWAHKRRGERAAIEAGLIPLVPAAAAARAHGHGTVLPVVPDIGIDDAAVVNFVRSVGVTRVLEAAVAVEAAQ